MVLIWQLLNCFRLTVINTLNSGKQYFKRNTIPKTNTLMRSVPDLFAQVQLIERTWNISKKYCKNTGTTTLKNDGKYFTFSYGIKVLKIYPNGVIESLRKLLKMRKTLYIYLWRNCFKSENKKSLFELEARVKIFGYWF